MDIVNLKRFSTSADNNNKLEAKTEIKHKLITNLKKKKMYLLRKKLFKTPRVKMNEHI